MGSIKPQVMVVVGKHVKHVCIFLLLVVEWEVQIHLTAKKIVFCSPSNVNQEVLRGPKGPWPKHSIRTSDPNRGIGADQLTLQNLLKRICLIVPVLSLLETVIYVFFGGQKRRWKLIQPHPGSGSKLWIFIS